ncbi:MAG: iron hydrogenase small subunit, partial [Clostridia bacterium]|nr:iron hydrogenase small subunit [Clostridia bacterium]
YEIDQGSEVRKSHENPAVTQLYDEFLKKILDHEAHELLHTYYSARKD